MNNKSRVPADDQHQQTMQKLKEAVDASVVAATKDQGTAAKKPTDYANGDYYRAWSQTGTPRYR